MTPFDLWVADCLGGVACTAFITAIISGAVLLAIAIGVVCQEVPVRTGVVLAVLTAAIFAPSLATAILLPSQHTYLQIREMQVKDAAKEVSQ